MFARLRSHQLDYAARLLLTHRDRRTRLVHVATDFGILTAILMLLGTVSLAPAGMATVSLATVTAAAIILYTSPLEPLAVLIAAIPTVVLWRFSGGTFRAPGLGLVLPVGLYFACSGIAGLSHLVFGDRTIVDFSSRSPAMVLSYLRTALTSAPHFVLLVLLDAGYRPRLAAQLQHRAAELQAASAKGQS